MRLEKDWMSKYYISVVSINVTYKGFGKEIEFVSENFKIVYRNAYSRLHFLLIKEKESIEVVIEYFYKKGEISFRVLAPESNAECFFDILTEEPRTERSKSISELLCDFFNKCGKCNRCKGILSLDEQCNLLIEQTGCSVDKAKEVIAKNNGDLVSSIMELMQ